jgi:uncharacterized protein (DUF433 family)
MTLQSLEPQLLALTAGEKATAITILTRNLNNGSLGITKIPNICGGDACIANIRIPIWLLVSLRRQGSNDAELLQFYPHLNAIDLVNAWAYAAAYPEEIETAIQEEAEA